MNFGAHATGTPFTLPDHAVRPAQGGSPGLTT
jgi:hypothetical protein